MNNLKCLITFSLFLILTALSAQTKKTFEWPNGAKAAIALTYDDGLPSHIDTVAPMLKKYNFKATFYPTVSSPSLYEHMDQWKNLAIEGHELGNHTVYHPCQKSKKGMEWVKDYYDLDKYTSDQIAEEIKLANTLLLALDGKKNRSFAYPCAHYFAGGESYQDFIASEFSAARGASGVQEPLINVADIDLSNVQSWAPNNHSGEDLISYIKEIIKHETFSTITFHGVGAEHLRVSTAGHEKMLQFLDANRDKIWVGTFEEITEYIEAKRSSVDE